MNKMLMVAGLLAMLAGCALHSRDEPVPVQVESLGPEARAQLDQLLQGEGQDGSRGQPEGSAVRVSGL